MKIGVMQGRLVRPSGKRIQEFPSKLWREELKIASKLNINLIEWVIDKKSIETNPIIKNLDEVVKLTSESDIQIESISDDYFLQETRNNILENKSWACTSLASHKTSSSFKASLKFFS